MSQESFAENIITKIGLDLETSTTKQNPYRSGHHLDKIHHVDMSENERKIIKT